MPIIASGAKQGHGDDEAIARDDQEVERPALENAKDADHQGDADRECHGQSQVEGVVVPRLGRVDHHAGLGGDPGRLLGHGDQRRLRDRGTEPEGEGEDQQPGEIGLPGERRGQRLPDREQRHLQAPDEERQPQHDHRQPDQDRGQIGQRLPQHRELEEGDDGDDRGQVAERADEEAEKA